MNENENKKGITNKTAENWNICKRNGTVPPSGFHRSIYNAVLSIKSPLSVQFFGLFGNFSANLYIFWKGFSVRLNKDILSFENGKHSQYYWKYKYLSDICEWMFRMPKHLNEKWISMKLNSRAYILDGIH